MPPKKGRRKEPPTGQPGIMSFFGGGPPAAAAPSSRAAPPITSPKAAGHRLPGSVVAAPVLDLTGNVDSAAESSSKCGTIPGVSPCGQAQRPVETAAAEAGTAPPTAATGGSGRFPPLAPASGTAKGGLRSGKIASGGGQAGFIRAIDLVERDQLRQSTASDGNLTTERAHVGVSRSDAAAARVSRLSGGDSRGVSLVSDRGSANKNAEVSEAARAAAPSSSFRAADKSANLSSWGSLQRGGCSNLANPIHRQQRRPPIVLLLHVVGLQFRDASASEHQDCHPGAGAVLTLEREPYNSHDQNAIKVLLPPSAGSRFLGYIPGRVASILALIIDAPSGTVARVTLKTVGERDEIGGGGGGRRTLPATLEVEPLSGADKEPFLGLMVKLREAAKKEDKRQKKRQTEDNAHRDRLRSKQKTLLLDFGRSAAKGEAGSAGAASSERGGQMLESMPWEVLWEMFCSPGISSRELFGPIRAVCQNWQRAVDTLPCAAARRKVALVCAGQTRDPATSARDTARPSDEGVEGPASSQQGGRSGLAGSIAPEDSHLAESRSRSPADVSKGATRSCESRDTEPCPGEGGAKAPTSAGWVSDDSSKSGSSWWDAVRARLVQGGGFTECNADDVLRRLDWAAGQEDINDTGTTVSAASSGEGASDRRNALAASGDEIQEAAGHVGADSDPGRRRDRMLGHLAATRALCVEWGLVAAPESNTSGAKFNTSKARGSGAGKISAPGGWSGWEAFALAVVTSSSVDRLSLCCWAVRPLMSLGRVDATGLSCPGLPRGEVIELLCLILCALRSLERDGAAWVGLAEGSVRLKGDLLVCARVLENWDVRFQKPGQPGAGPPAPGMGGGGASGLISSLTSEQRSIVLADVKPGEVLTVLAFAGTGKTTCLRAYAQARPHLRVLYLTFNVSVREEAEKTFPPHADCKGVHQLAFRHVGRRYQSKLTQDLREADVQAFLKYALEKEIKLSEASRVLAALSAFFSSDSHSLSLAHVKPPAEFLLDPSASEDGEESSGDDEGVGGSKGGSQGERRAVSAAPAPTKPPPIDEDTVLDWATLCWTAMQAAPAAPKAAGGSRGGDEGGFLGMTHSGYLKLFQLSSPCLSRTYDVIMLDEAQDSNPCIANIVLRETGCARILVGDSHQAIYGFIGAKDHLKAAPGGKVRHLTQVFRFDQSIAHVANTLVGTLRAETRPLLGCAGKTGEVVLAEGTGLNIWHPQGCGVKRPIAFLARTVATLVQAAMRARHRREKVAWVGGAQAYSLEAIEDVCLMMVGRSEEVRSPLLKRLKTMKALVRFIEESGDRQWGSRVRMLEGKDPRELLSELQELQRAQVHPKHADVILSTVHKAKGLEFDTVVLADDFIEVDVIFWTHELKPSPIWASQEDAEEVNILYVAVTRAKRKLVLNSSLRAFLQNTGSWNSVCLRGISSLRDVASSTLAQGASPKCGMCGTAASFGGGGARIDNVTRKQAAEISAQAPARGRGPSGAPRDMGVGEGLLYAESGSLLPLCCWCAEKGTEAVLREGGLGLAPTTTFPVRSRFPYATVLMRGLAPADCLV